MSELENLSAYVVFDESVSGVFEVREESDCFRQLWANKRRCSHVCHTHESGNELSPV